MFSLGIPPGFAVFATDLGLVMSATTATGIGLGRYSQEEFP